MIGFCVLEVPGLCHPASDGFRMIVVEIESGLSADLEAGRYGARHRDNFLPSTRMSNLLLSAVR